MDCCCHAKLIPVEKVENMLIFTWNNGTEEKAVLRVPIILFIITLFKCFQIWCHGQGVLATESDYKGYISLH